MGLLELESERDALRARLAEESRRHMEQTAELVQLAEDRRVRLAEVEAERALIVQRAENAEAALEQVEGKLAEAEALCEKQAEDDGLWFVAEYASEAMLQAALRELHRVIEGATVDQPKKPENKPENKPEGLAISDQPRKHSPDCSYWDGLFAQVCNCGTTADQPTVRAECQHEWIDARNNVISSGEWCRKCSLVRAGNEATGP